MSLNIQKLVFNVSDDEMYTIARKYKINKNILDESLEKIKEWYNCQPYFPKGAFDDRIFMGILSLCNFSMVRTKEVIDNLLTARVIFPEIYQNRDPFDEKLLDTMKSLQYALMPKRTENNERIYCVRFTDRSPDCFDHTQMFKLSCMLWDLRLMYDVFTDDHVIVDLTHFKLGHALKYTLPAIKRSNFIYMDCYPTHAKAIHVIRLPGYAQTFLNLWKSVMDTKLSERLVFHDDYESLHKVFDPEYLPEEFKGSALSMEKHIDSFFNAIQHKDVAKWLIDSGRLVADESKRPKKSHDKSADVIGIVGSFRKLDID